MTWPGPHPQPILWTLGIIVLVIGLIFVVLGMAGHAVGGRRHYW